MASTFCVDKEVIPEVHENLIYKEARVSLPCASFFCPPRV
jgi:hypothetical protein